MDTTFVVKTIYRPVKCQEAIESVRQQYPDAPIVVCDDGPEEYQLSGDLVDRLDVQYCVYPFDHGIGACYNDILRHVIDTPYVVMLDDDFVFDERTDIAHWRHWLEHGAADLMGGAIYKQLAKAYQRYVGRFEWHGMAPSRELFMHAIPVVGARHPLCADFTMNWYMACTELLRAVPYDETLKVSRHEDYFLQLWEYGAHVWYHPDVIVTHTTGMPPHPPSEYNDLRHGRIKEFHAMFEHKWGLRSNGCHYPKLR